jgi:hypothetical protein
MGDAGQNQKQGELAEWLLARGGSNAEVGGDMLQGMERAGDGAGSGIGKRGMVKLTSEEQAEGIGTGFGPGGELEERTVYDFAVFARGLTQEDGWGSQRELNDNDDDSVAVSNFNRNAQGKIRRKSPCGSSREGWLLLRP